MGTSIFIKTWENDVKWLKYCLRSIQKFGWGFDEIVVVADESCDRIQIGLLPANVTSLVFVEDWTDGRLQQQAIKMLADTYTTSENIVFVDSDCVYNRVFHPGVYFRDGKPIIYKQRYGNVGISEKWKEITENVVGWEVEFEYMRVVPWAFRSSTLGEIRKAFPQLQSHIKSCADGDSFSEFNVMGAFAEKYEPEKYCFIDIDNEPPDIFAKWYWSWGGITEDIQKEITSILMGPD